MKEIEFYKDLFASYPSEKLLEYNTKGPYFVLPYFVLLYNAWIARNNLLRRDHHRKDKNIIFFGPPGTGKTYQTKVFSLEKIFFEYGTLETIYKAHTDNHSIVFTTFHQSQSYEDFIEGIKPVTVKGNVTYETRDGLFKKLCYLAFAKCFNITNINHGWSTLSVNELQSNLFSNQQKYVLSYSILKKEVLNRIANLDPCNLSEPIVLIIDEINRGNISQIFGELITLIEEDKRYSAENAISVTLPYSGESFIVPPNLYIIGTMNTADRSVEALDTALRRRFIFTEMKPKYDDLLKITIQGINVGSMLQHVNNKISEIKGSRDYEIGHAYFWPLIEDPSLDKLKSIFVNSILPLLKEYFYGDYSSIKNILHEIDTDNDPVVLEETNDFYDVQIENIYNKHANYFIRIYSET